ncbi:unnamed protein product [Larinioides sclopetarius]|uniref:Uncharacterized protein n=1 Tax=Larinioides sclopetarius TaxID=280406 RepID=A0AAV2BT24_9ARAC
MLNSFSEQYVVCKNINANLRDFISSNDHVFSGTEYCTILRVGRYDGGQEVSRVADALHCKIQNF